MKNERSAGAVIFRKNNKTMYLLLEYAMGHWDFPKGNIEKGETEEETIKREVKEETGIGDLKITKDFREVISYFYKLKGELVSKKVVFYLAETKTFKIRLSFEHKGYKWLPFKEAVEKLTFKNAKEILKKADAFLKKNPRLSEFMG
jgi:8-oxo-dGTP pyrophosphatase MutT (NUDIX family)